MEIRVRFKAGVIVFNVAGRLVLGSRPSLRACISELATNRRAIVLIHMGGVTDMDAHGIGELVSSLTSVERHGGRMAIIAPSAFVRHLLAITRLDTVMAIHDTEFEALATLCPTVLTAAMSGNGFEQHETQLCI
jgi:anti-sigma B factor antagonist